MMAYASVMHRFKIQVHGANWIRLIRNVTDALWDVSKPSVITTLSEIRLYVALQFA